MKPGPRKYEQLANALARSAVKIVRCGLCGYPRIDGYICPTCGGDDSIPAEERAKRGGKP